MTTQSQLLIEESVMSIEQEQDGRTEEQLTEEKGQRRLDDQLT